MRNVQDKLLKRSESDFAQSGDISVSKWMDRGKKSVCVASNMHDPRLITTVKRTNHKGEKETVPCPESIAAYNKHMGGVDKFDQYMSTYSIGWKSTRWWLRILYYLLESAVVNSYIIYQKNCKIKNTKKKWMTIVEFRSLLANELINDFSSRKKIGCIPGHSFARTRDSPTGRKTVVNSLRFSNVGNHLLEVGTRRRCAHCSTKEKQKRSSLCRKTCNVALCKKCFLPFHK